jgi:hypothetical protein
VLVADGSIDLGPGSRTNEQPSRWRRPAS